jgi:hypothetical protein
MSRDSCQLCPETRHCRGHRVPGAPPQKYRLNCEDRSTLPAQSAGCNAGATILIVSSPVRFISWRVVGDRDADAALDLISEKDERADALYSLGQTLNRFGHYAEAAVAFHRGAELFEGRDEQVRLRFEGAAWSAQTHLTLTQDGSASAANVNGDGPGDRAVLAAHALNAALTIPPAARAGDPRPRCWRAAR